MKKAFITAVVVIAGLAIWYSFREPVSNPPAKTAASPMSMKTLKSEPVPKTELETAKVAAAQPQTPQACTAMWERTAALSLQQLQEDLKRGVLRLDAECLKFETQNDLVSKTYAACAYQESTGKLADEANCLSTFPLYRSICADRMTPDQKDYRSMSLSLLANKIIGRFFLNQQKPEGRPELRAMAEAMVEREPTFFEARKALVAIDMGGLFGPQPEVEAMRSSVEGAMKLNPNDPQLTEAYLLTEQIGGNTAAANAFVERNPDSGLGYYYRAWSEWNGGDHENALADLQQAARLLPGDQRVAKTLGDAQTGKADGLFNMSVGFSFEDL